MHVPAMLLLFRIVGKRLRRPLDDAIDRHRTEQREGNRETLNCEGDQRQPPGLRTEVLVCSSNNRFRKIDPAIQKGITRPNNLAKDARITMWVASGGCNI